MVVPALCSAAYGLLRDVEPGLVLEQLGSTFFDTALLMVVKHRSNSSSSSQQDDMSNFFMIHELIVRLVPIVPTVLLARAGDRGWRRAPVVVPLCGYLLSRVMLLLVALLQLPLQVMYGSAVLFGLCGGYCTYWPGVMTLVSLRSTTQERSKDMMRVELMYGAAGLVGSLVSGHLFSLYSSSLGNGTILISVSTLLNLLSLLHAIFLLRVRTPAFPQPEPEEVLEEEKQDACHILSQEAANAPVEVPAKMNLVNMALLFICAMLYSAAVGGAVQMLGVFVLKEPLSWTATQVGYGNAAGCSIFFTSFLGMIVFRRWASDLALILIGLCSFAGGMYFMSFVTTTAMFYLARSLTLFALIPLPTIRSQLSQQVPASSCGTTLTALQLSLKFASLAYIPTYTKIYQRTLDWFPGFVFMLSSILTVLAMIPISILGCRSRRRNQYERIQGD